MDQYINTKDIRSTFEHLTDEYAYTEFLPGIYVTETWIEDIKPADVEPVRHGHWVWMGESGCKCSLCKKRIRIRERRTFEYCPKCGAKMDGKEEDEEIKNV